MDGLDYEYYVIQQKIGVLNDHDSDGELIFDASLLAKPSESRFKIYILQEYSLSTINAQNHWDVAIIQPFRRNRVNRW
jgi:hypothetical protein